ncbi:DELLA protein RGL2 [Abeliophyllum distichum]|uniref:DELLA protein RGL2 n=1 Tax=Abeliophyllum distichum TaxID=126358 RepID=A0ABD1T278_9LAMI
MPNGVFLGEEYTSNGVSYEYSSSKSTWDLGGENSTNQNGLFGGGEWPLSDFDPFSSSIGFYQAQDSMTVPGLDVSENQIRQQIKQLTDFGSFDDLYLDVVSPPFQSSDGEYRKLVSVDSENSELNAPKKKRHYGFSSGSLEILKRYGSRFRRFNSEKVNVPSSEIQYTDSSGPTPAAELIIQLAAEKLIQFSFVCSDELSMLNHPYPSSILADSAGDSKEVHLVQNLLLSAKNVGERQYERAIKLLRECDRMSSTRGSPVQRLVFYFTEALYEKIDRETGTVTPKGLGKKTEDPLEALKFQDSTLIAFHCELPLAQITRFAGTQALVEHVAEARKVHIIDLQIRNGIYCTILMQALSTRFENPIEHLRMTVVGTKSKEKIEATGRRLTSFAQSLNMPFSFNIVMAEDILDLNKDLFRLDDDEAITIYAAYTLKAMIGCPDRLEHMMRVIRTINPRVMIFTEIEANCNSPIFVDRFVEALFYYGAFFDFIANCMKDDEKNRRDAESTYFSSSIRNIVAAEGEERKIRHVSMRVWRAFFARFGLVEVDLSMSSMYQANLILKKFSCGNACTFDMDGKCLIIGWKGTPLSSLSAWKFK